GYVHDPFRDLVIITGTGEGRQEGKGGRLKPAVMQLLQQDITPSVACREHDYNAGRLVVPASGLQAY
ncbi:unnamed protein product, partial [Choristocarpus tenellus]